MSKDRDIELLVQLAHGAQHPDLRVRLGALDELRVATERAWVDSVERARRRGLTWEEIARHAGLASRQAAYARASRLSVRSSR